MRTMHVIGSRQEGGAERGFLRLTRALARHGLDVLAVLRPTSVLSARMGDGVRRELVRMRSVFDPFARARIASLARAFDAQIVQTYMGRATRLTRLAARPPATTALHVARVGGYHDPKGFRHAHAWITTTEGIRGYLVDQGFAAERVFCIRNPVDPPVPQDRAALRALRAELGIEPDAHLLACIGRLHRDRGLDIFLDALARLPARSDGRVLRALIVGDGPQRDALREQAQRLGLAARVSWVVGPAQPLPYLGLADLFVYPSREAAVGSAVVEAWNAGVPVVATDTAGPLELIEPGRTGMLVPREDPDALAGAIASVLGADDAVRQAMVAAARERIGREHAASVVATATLRVYRELLSTAA
jgi:glycosyltransferase involved in cell wall biosynthesis